MPLLLALCGVLWSRDALASHFRYGTIAWTVPDPQNAPLTVKFTVTTAWRSANIGGTALNFGDGVTNPSVIGTTVGTGTDASNNAYTVTSYTVTHTYAAAGSYTAFFESSARVAGLQNGSNGSFRVDTKVGLATGNTSGPVSSAPAIIQMQTGGVRTYTFPSYDPDGDAVSCRFATSGEMWAAPYPPASDNIPTEPLSGKQPTLSSGLGGCVMNWDLTQAETGKQYVLHVVLESTHGGLVSSTAIDLIIETVAAAPPSCTGSGTFSAQVGVPFTTSTTGTNPGGGNLTMVATNAPAGSSFTPASGTSEASPRTNVFAWTPTAAFAGTTQIVVVTYTNSTNASGQCFLTIQVPQCSNFGETCSAGVGECFRTGTKVCAGPGVTVCSVTAGAPTAEICDGKDNNCDGQVDEGNPGSGQACVTGLPGACAGGTTSCAGGSLTCVATITPGQQPETCNGQDDNCNGTVDEGFNLGAACTAGVGECQQAGTIVCGGGVAVCSAVPKPSTPEVCDGKDNDCDGSIDNGNPGSGQACTSSLPGVCAAGSTTCGASGSLVCVPTIAPGQQSETCNGLDDDCDGQTDEGFNLGAACTVGVGECLEAGIIECQQGAAVCDAIPGTPVAETCDGKDNDCDGTVDNGQPGGGQTCTSDSPGVCAAGSTLCSQNTVTCIANITPGTLTETCNGLDDDCDGQTDEGFNVGAPCTVGVGECQQLGALVCDPTGVAVCNAIAGTPGVETCDGKDNDCDGTVDNGNPGGGVACSTGLPGICSGGTTVCSLGAIACTVTTAPGTTAEVCDGLDNDCDGQVDNGFNVGSDCSAGVGACARTGTTICDAQGGSTCSATPGTAVPEVCGDAIDGDCDGSLNNGCQCLTDPDCNNAGEICDAGVGGTYTCIAGCRNGGGCPTGKLCTSNDTIPGACVECIVDADCGGVNSGKVCNGTTNSCVDGCRGQGGNGCPSSQVCSSATPVIGQCVACVVDSDCGGTASGKVCATATNTCIDGCHGAGSGNGCASPLVCTSDGAGLGACVGCVADSDCGGTASGTICDPTSHTCIAGCHGQGGNGCAPPLTCTSFTPAPGQCVGCTTDANCGSATSGTVCNTSTQTCVTGCRGQGGNGCSTGQVCTSADDTVGQCVGCNTDTDCGSATSARVCDAASHACVDGCRGQGGNGCASPLVCTSTDATVGQCVGCNTDADCGPATSGTICDASTHTCGVGCRGQGGNGCAPPLTCTSTTSAAGQCVGCTADSDCGSSTSGQVCTTSTQTCDSGCRGQGGNGCSTGQVCTSTDATVGQCVGCNTDADCGGLTSGRICSATSHACVDGCRGQGGNGCPTDQACTSTTADAGQCVGCNTDSDCGNATSGKVCNASSHTCEVGCRGEGGNGCPSNQVCTSTDTTVGQCAGCATDADCGSTSSGKVCDATTNSCVDGCRGQGGNGCPSNQVCSSSSAVVGQCVGCTADTDCGSGKVCDTATKTCVSGPASGCTSDTQCASGQHCDSATKACVDGCNTADASSCPAPSVCQAQSSGPARCVTPTTPTPTATPFNDVEGAGGCAVSPGGRSSTDLAPVIVLAAALVARRRRRLAA